MVASVILNIPKFLEARLEEVANLHNLTFLPIILRQTVLLILLLSFLVRWKTDLRRRMWQNRLWSTMWLSSGSIPTTSTITFIGRGEQLFFFTTMPSGWDRGARTQSGRPTRAGTFWGVPNVWLRSSACNDLSVPWDYLAVCSLVDGGGWVQLTF